MQTRLALAPVVFFCALISACGSDRPPVTGSGPTFTATPETLVELPELRSQGGTLRAALEAAPGSLELGGTTVRGALFYNGRTPAATWRVKPGDRVQVDVSNALSEHTNLHFHGFHVSPSGKADNVFTMISSGGTFSYDVPLPATHPPGLHWFHPHHHGHATKQVH